jgi:small subunit ribosomal protein S6
MAQSKNQYELTYVISGVVKQNQVDDIVRKITQFVKDNGGDILEVDEWGNQRLAYEIDKKRSGYYVNMYFRAPGDLIPKLERQLKINDDVLRFLTLRMDAKMQRHYEKQKGKEKRKAHSAVAEEDDSASDGEEDDDGDDESEDDEE